MNYTIHMPSYEVNNDFIEYIDRHDCMFETYNLLYSAEENLFIARCEENKKLEFVFVNDKIAGMVKSGRTFFCYFEEVKRYDTKTDSFVAEIDLQEVELESALEEARDHYVVEGIRAECNDTINWDLEMLTIPLTFTKAKGDKQVLVSSAKGHLKVRSEALTELLSVNSELHGVFVGLQDRNPNFQVMRFVFHIYKEMDNTNPMNCETNEEGEEEVEQQTFRVKLNNNIRNLKFLRDNLMKLVEGESPKYLLQDYRSSLAILDIDDEEELIVFSNKHISKYLDGRMAVCTIGCGDDALEMEIVVSPLVKEEQEDSSQDQGNSLSMEEKTTFQYRFGKSLQNLTFFRDHCEKIVSGYTPSYLLRPDGTTVYILDFDTQEELTEFEHSEISSLLHGRLAVCSISVISGDLDIEMTIIPAKDTNEKDNTAKVHYEMAYDTNPGQYDLRRKAIMDGKVNLSVVGLQFRDDYEDVFEQLYEGMKLTLIPEPTNVVDKNALAFYMEDGTLVGYLPRKDQPFARCLLKQGCIEALVTEITDTWLDTEVLLSAEMIDKAAAKNDRVTFTRIESASGCQNMRSISIEDFIKAIVTFN